MVVVVGGRVVGSGVLNSPPVNKKAQRRPGAAQYFARFLSTAKPYSSVVEAAFSDKVCTPWEERSCNPPFTMTAAV